MSDVERPLACTLGFRTKVFLVLEDLEFAREAIDRGVDDFSGARLLIPGGRGRFHDGRRAYQAPGEEGLIKRPVKKTRRTAVEIPTCLAGIRA
ncbi:hypothetical protein NMY22_g12220 [Coprinellus aureogranulatus]|nr:hypothetical protein NMY22_g12220 [Coprinellus aureogranulatus]